MPFFLFPSRGPFASSSREKRQRDQWVRERDRERERQRERERCEGRLGGGQMGRG